MDKALQQAGTNVTQAVSCKMGFTFMTQWSEDQEEWKLKLAQRPYVNIYSTIYSWCLVPGNSLNTTDSEWVKNSSTGIQWNDSLQTWISHGYILWDDYLECVWLWEKSQALWGTWWFY